MEARLRSFYTLMCVWSYDVITQTEADWLHRSNHVYYYTSGNEEVKWGEAQDDCKERGANLVTINDNGENQFLYDSILPNFRMWIGLHCAERPCTGDNGLTWSSGGTSNFRDFTTIASVSPLRYVYFQNRKWHAGNERNEENRYICEKPDGCHNPDNPCQNGGTCDPDNRDGYTCHCRPAYTGNTCQTRLYCASGPCAHGRCGEGERTYECDCSGTGYTGRECHRDVNECADTPSICNNGTCQNTNGSFTCTCHAGYRGNTCQHDINECEQGICENGGSCENSPGSYTCSCRPGYAGDKCQHDINECHSNPCMNSGQCVDNVNSYSCDCPPSFTGVHCETDVNECLVYHYCGDSNCTNTPGGYACDCPRGYEGPHCSDDIDECESMDICHRHGNCTNVPGGYNCTCEEGYDPLQDCKPDRGTEEQSGDNDSEEIALLRRLLIGCSAVLIVLIAVFVGLLIDDRRRARRDAERRQLFNARRNTTDAQAADSAVDSQNDAGSDGFSNTANNQSADFNVADSAMETQNAAHGFSNAAAHAATNRDAGGFYNAAAHDTAKGDIGGFSTMAI